MATDAIPLTSPKLALSATQGISGLYVLGDADVSRVSAWTIQLVNVDTFMGSITVKARSAAPAAGPDGDDVDFVATVYRNLWLNGSAGDGSLVATAITDASLIIVPSDGMQIALDVTNTSGTAALYVTARSGPSVL